MPAPALRGGTGGPSVGDTMLAYVGYGFSVLPIAPGTKKPYSLLLPSQSWKTYQQRQATPDEIQDWTNTRPDMGVGIICGSVSGGLYCLDVDDAGFAAWIESNLTRFPNVWIVRSGSGLIHVYVRSKIPALTTVIVGSMNGTSHKLADVRGNGHGRNGPSYMVAPPTVHPTGNPYRTLSGDPEHIFETADALQLFNILRDKFVGVSPTVSPPKVSLDDDEAVVSGDKTIADPPSEARWIEVMSRLNGTPLSRKVRKAIAEGATFGEGMWSGAPTNSEIDHRVVKELRTVDWSIADIEEVFAGSPLRVNCYANKQRGNHGHGYLMQSIVAVDKEKIEAESAAHSAIGHNFTVLGVTRVGYEDPLYEVVMSFEGRRGVAKLHTEHLMDSHRFQTQVARELNFLPMFDRSFEGHHFARFGALIMRMAGQEEVPMSATEQGHLRGVTLQIISQEIDPQEPEDERMMRLGWRNGQMAYVRGAAVLRHLQNVIRPSPKPERVWSVLRAMGGEEETHQWISGRKEALWLLPLAHLVE